MRLFTGCFSSFNLLCPETPKGQEINIYAGLQKLSGQVAQTGKMIIKMIGVCPILNTGLFGRMSDFFCRKMYRYSHKGTKSGNRCITNFHAPAQSGKVGY